MDWNQLFLLLSISAIILTPRKASSQCSSPSKKQVQQSLTTTVEQSLTIGASLESLVLHNFNIVCYAVKGLNSYSSLSVVVNFTETISGAASSGIYQFQMECDTKLGWVNNGEGPRTVSESYLVVEPRYDCISCSYTQNDDAVRLCAGNNSLSSPLAKVFPSNCLILIARL